MTTQERNKAGFRRVYEEGLNRGVLAVADELIVEGETVAGRLTMNGTHDGPLMGMPPTGRQVRQAHMHFVRFRDGKAIEHWGVRDDMGMMRQLGAVPQPTGTSA